MLSMLSAVLLLAGTTQVLACTSDAECGYGEWCRTDYNVYTKTMCAYTRSCVPRVGEGKACEGTATLLCAMELCQPGLVCVSNLQYPDLPGVCTAVQYTPTACTSDDECAASEWCRLKESVYAPGVCARDSVCVARRLEGETCTTAAESCTDEQCAAELVCDEESLVCRQQKEYKGCPTTCGALVPHGWSGYDDGSNHCNTCRCTDGALACTRRGCLGEKLCAPADPCASKECPANLICTVDAGKPQCVIPPEACCLAAATCPAGSEAVEAEECTDAELASGTCAYTQICCSRQLCRTVPTFPCDGFNTCNVNGLVCQKEDLCLDAPRDDCDPAAGDEACRGCCVADACRTTVCEAEETCATDRYGVPYCQPAPFACCMAMPRCPEGTRQVEYCGLRDLQAGACAHVSMCCTQIACQTV